MVRNSLIMSMFVAIRFVVGSVAHAELINVNMVAHNGDGIGPNRTLEVEAGLVGPAGGLGTTWNQLPDPAGNFVPPTGITNLLDSTGAVTTVGFNFNLPYTDPWGNPSLTMLRSAYYNPGWDDWGVCEITGLDPNKTYNLYIASFYPNENGSSGDFTTNNTTSNGAVQSVNNGGSGGNDSTWVQGDNYVLFADLVPDGTGKFTFFVYNQFNKLMVNGFQLESASPSGIPAPAALPAGLAMLGLIVARRRRSMR